MSMNTPVGQIQQTSPIKNFKELSKVELEQYLLGINNISQGDGSKVTLQNLLTSMVSEDTANLLEIGNDGKLAVKSNTLTNDTGWVTPPTLTVNWENKTVTGAGGQFMQDGVVVDLLSEFTISGFNEGNGNYYLYYNSASKEIEWSKGYPTVNRDYINHICEIVIMETGSFAIQTWGFGGTSKDLINYLNNTIGMTVLAGGVIDGVETGNVEKRKPAISQTEIGTANFNQTFVATQTGETYTQAHASGNTIAFETGKTEIVPVGSSGMAQYLSDNGLTDLEADKYMNVWLFALPTAGTSPENMSYLYVTGSGQYDDLASAKVVDFGKDKTIKALGENFYRYCPIARFTIQNSGGDFSIMDYSNISSISGGSSSAGGGGTVVTGGGNEGIPPSICKNLVINTSGTTVKLKWQDPDDTILDKQYLCTWAGTKIVKKLGSYPTKEDDGILVIDNTVHNQYLKTEFEDTINSGEDWKYRAFPYSTHNVHCYNNRNCFTPAVIYEVCVNPNESNPNNAVTYPSGCLNENFIPMGLRSNNTFNEGDWSNTWIMQGIYPCMLKYDTTEAYKLNKNDFRYREDGVTLSDVANANFGGNCMIRFPQIWFKWELDGTLWHLYISNVQVDDSYFCFTHINVNGELVDSVYLMAFQPSVINGRARSLSGKAIAVNTTGTAEIQNAQANGLGWDLWNYGQIQMLQHLQILMTKSLDSQTKFGKGRDSNNANNTTGELISAGMFAGTIATGGMKAFGIENLFANYWKRCNGAMYTSSGFMYKLGYGTSDGSTVSGYNTTANGYISGGLFTGTSGGYYSKALMTSKGLVPSVAKGSASTFFCDGLWWNNGSFAVVGGAYGGCALAGLFCLTVDGAVSVSRAGIGGSLSCVPL